MLIILSVVFLHIVKTVSYTHLFISDFECKYKLSFIRKYKLGEVLQRVGHSGFCDYRLVRFDLEKLAEYDREGVKKFLAEQEGGHAQMENAGNRKDVYKRQPLSMPLEQY